MASFFKTIQCLASRARVAKVELLPPSVIADAGTVVPPWFLQSHFSLSVLVVESPVFYL